MEQKIKRLSRSSMMEIEPNKVRLHLSFTDETELCIDLAYGQTIELKQQIEHYTTRRIKS